MQHGSFGADVSSQNSFIRCKKAYSSPGRKHPQCTRHTDLPREVTASSVLPTPHFICTASPRLTHQETLSALHRNSLDMPRVDQHLARVTRCLTVLLVTEERDPKHGGRARVCQKRSWWLWDAQRASCFFPKEVSYQRVIMRH